MHWKRETFYRFECPTHWRNLTLVDLQRPCKMYNLSCHVVCPVIAVSQDIQCSIHKARVDQRWNVIYRLTFSVTKTHQRITKYMLKACSVCKNPFNFKNHKCSWKEKSYNPALGCIGLVVMLEYSWHVVEAFSSCSNHHNRHMIIQWLHLNHWQYYGRTNFAIYRPLSCRLTHCYKD